MREVTFEGDAKEVIEAVQSNEVDESWRGQVVEDLKKLLATFMKLSLDSGIHTQRGMK